MTIPLHSTASLCVHALSTERKRSLSCSTKAFVVQKLQSAGGFGIGKPNVNVDFPSRVHKSLSLRLSNADPTRRRISMMSIGTPMVPYLSRDESWPLTDIWNVFLKDRIILMGEYINETISNNILGTMLYLDSIESSKPLQLYISSPGGNVTPCLAIYDTMRSLASPIYTRCVGFTYNLPVLILAAGNKGDRVAMPRTRIILQSPVRKAHGQADAIHIEANELLRIRDYLFEELAKQTGQPVEKIHKDMSRPKSFSAKEAVEYGLIDRIT